MDGCFVAEADASYTSSRPQHRDIAAAAEDSLVCNHYTAVQISAKCSARATRMPRSLAYPNRT